MKKEIQLVAIDLDDTLLHDDNTVSERTIRTVQAVREKGVHIVIATGRMYKTTKPVAEALELGDVPLIIYSGGAVQMAESGEVKYENAIPVDLSHAILALAKENAWYIQSYIDDELLIPVSEARTEAYVKATAAEPKVIGEAFYAPTKGPVKLLAIDTREALDRIAATIQEHFGDAVETVRSKEIYLEIVAKGTSKGAAMLSMAQQLGIDPSCTMAIGNSQNDISMLEAAAVSVAVGNADANVKEMAQIVTASNEEDGVADVLASYFLS